MINAAAAPPQHPIRHAPLLLIGPDLGSLAAVAVAFEHQAAIWIASSVPASLPVFTWLRPGVVMIEAVVPQSEAAALGRTVWAGSRLRDIAAAAAVPAVPVVLTAPPGAYGVIVMRPRDLHELPDGMAALLVSWSPGVRAPRYRAPLLKAIDFSAQHYAGSIHAPAIARASGLSIRRLSDLFRLTGYSIMGYVARLRVEVAKSLLIADEIRLETVAERAGFSDASHLSRVFLGVVGQRPGEYRRTVLRGASGPS